MSSDPGKIITPRPNLGATSAIALEAALRDVQAEDVAKAIALVIARKGITDDGGFKSVNRDELAQETADQMWPHLLDEAKAAMKVCGIG
jgi:hypothetical protein